MNVSSRRIQADLDDQEFINDRRRHEGGFKLEQTDLLASPVVDCQFQRNLSKSVSTHRVLGVSLIQR